MNELHDEDQVYLPPIGKLMERIDLGTIAVDEYNQRFSLFGSGCPASSTFAVITASGGWAMPTQTHLCFGAGCVGFSRWSSDSGKIPPAVRMERSTV